MKFKFLVGSAAMLMLAACTSNKTEGLAYTVTAELPETEAEMAYIINYDTSDKMDSAAIVNGVATFNGTVETPVLVRLIVDGKRAGSFILQDGEIKVVDRHAEGGDLNLVMDELEVNLADVDSAFSNLPDSIPFDRAAYKAAQKGVYDKYFAANATNPVGYYIFLQQAYDMSLEELNAAIEQYPALGEYTRISKLQSGKVAKAETSEGKPYKDFEVVYNDSTYRLSDYVGNGKYLLVDFWASWCGPCRAAIPHVKETAKKYGDRLDIISVSCDEDADAWRKAMADEKMTWAQYHLEGEQLPAAGKAYMISGIPRLLVFDQNGVLVCSTNTPREADAVLAKILAE